jgi:hypothetical protein
MQTQPLVKLLSVLFLVSLLLIVTFLVLRPVQAAPFSRPAQADILVTTTIQAAINTANPGDTVIVPAGNYTESLTLSKAVSLTGVSSATTIIHALPNQRVLTVTGAAISNSVVISGLTLTGGNVTGGDSCPTFCGGGLLITGTAQPLLQNLIIANNQAGWYGGGAYTGVGSPLTLVDTKFISNSTRYYGGGLATGDRSVITNVSFLSNRASRLSGGAGGGLATLGPATFITDSRFENNTSVSAGGLLGYNTTIKDTDFISNGTSWEGGGAIMIGSNTLMGGRFERNTSVIGGGGLSANGSLTITNIQFIRNNSQWGGGVFYYADSKGQIINSLFAGNTATDTGAALYISLAPPSSPGTLEILHTTIADIGLNPKPAIVVVSSTVGITNTTIASHSVAIGRTGGTVFEDYNLFFGNILNTTGVISNGGHSLSGDPKFVAPASDDYHLDAGSAALNVAFPGLAADDFEGDPRPLGPGPDIGFDESGATSPPNARFYLPLILKN